MNSPGVPRSANRRPETGQQRIGYQNAAHIAKAAIADNTTLREAALASGKVTAEQFDSIVKPTNMIGDGIAGA